MASKKIKRQKDLTVNLLPQDAFSKSSVGRVLNWSLSTGRYIVVFTEMIVILTFLSRFTLDRQLTDLNESILRKQAIVDSFGELESNIREIQAKTEFIRQLDSRVQAIELLTFLSISTPETVSYSNLSVRSDSFSLEAVALSPQAMSQFVDAVKTDPRFFDVTLGTVTTNENDTGIKFSIRANFEKKLDS